MSSRRLLAPFAVAGACLAGAVAVAAWNPGDNGVLLCPWRALTGIDCPLCGSTRAVAALAHGEVMQAVDRNAFLVLVLIPVAVLAWFAWVRAAREGRSMNPPAWFAWAFAGSLLVWWGMRLAVPFLGSSLT